MYKVHCSKISSLTNGSKFWIGITSDGLDGVRRRWNQEYKQCGMHHIAVVYTTSSDNYRRNAETDLIEYFKQQRANIQNENAGGGGPTGPPPYSVYVAWE